MAILVLLIHFGILVRSAGCPVMISAKPAVQPMPHRARAGRWRFDCRPTLWSGHSQADARVDGDDAAQLRFVV